MKIITIFFIAILISFGCKNTVEVEIEKIVEIEKESPLQFSGTAVFAVFAANNSWTGEQGLILFVKAFNSSDSTWYGVPELNTYAFVPNQNAPGGLISTGYGIMTSALNQGGVPVPVDTLANKIPGLDIRRTLTFTTVDWNDNPNGVWVYWRFVEQSDNQSMTKKSIFTENKIYLANPKLRLK